MLINSTLIGENSRATSNTQSEWFVSLKRSYNTVKYYDLVSIFSNIFSFNVAVVFTKV